MNNLKWLIWIAAGALLFFYIRTDIPNQDQVSATETLIKTYDPKLNPNQSLTDYLIFRAMISGEGKMAITGSSVAFGTGSSHQSNTWRGLIEVNFRNSNPALKKFKISNHGHPGYTSIRLLEDHVTAPILKEQPDILLIETSVINNHNKNVSLTDTFKSLDSLYQLYSQALPETRIVFLSPNPCTENKFGPPLNQFGLKFTDYVNETAIYIQNQGWTYFDTHGAMLYDMNAQNVTLASTLKDGIHPNDSGYKIWADVLWPFLKQKQGSLPNPM
ncbi:SGNH/GDSL hydrolase family protein [Paenisporosarcina antarctica]|uniref:SGNH/GDSL hydrolase family protein n=1 Tax=Paenisporosarcina antarctica TaxID=417367 RepID=A0A4P6ZWV6_9BACL|nr:SGNH/GDSL hydrolase family protein [Paenisporosarcina antarctica]QBP39976.1 SGNH/GDSL hydrolase family protein [Paenisporosarcina antarctica]